jgi:hypothetical protein
MIFLKKLISLLFFSFVFFNSLNTFALSIDKNTLYISNNTKSKVILKYKSLDSRNYKFTVRLDKSNSHYKRDIPFGSYTLYYGYIDKIKVNNYDFSNTKIILNGLAINYFPTEINIKEPLSICIGEYKMGLFLKVFVSFIVIIIVIFSILCIIGFIQVCINKDSSPTSDSD